jgi:hypothetical protein
MRVVSLKCARCVHDNVAHKSFRYPGETKLRVLSALRNATGVALAGDNLSLTETLRSPAASADDLG